MDLLSIGEMLIDFLPGDTPGSYLQNFGGAPANLAIAAARNGLKTGFCGKVGDDFFGRFLQDTLRGNGVEVLCRDKTAEAVTTMAFVSLAENGERTFTFARKPGADMFLTREDLPPSLIKQTSVLHAGSVSLSKGPAADATVYALETAHALGKQVSFDINYRDMLWDHDRESARHAVQNILPFVDWLKASDEEVDFLDGEANIPFLIEAYDLAFVVVTLGAKGARAYFNGQVLDVAGIPARATDTTGAGDAFWGGVISSLILQGVAGPAGLSASVLMQAMRYGNVSGHLSVQQKGAIASLPDRATIEEHVRRIYG